MTENSRAILREAIDLARDIGLTATAQRLKQALETDDSSHLDFCRDVMRTAIQIGEGMLPLHKMLEYRRLARMIRKAKRLAD